jgi:hypothetical protein
VAQITRIGAEQLSAALALAALLNGLLRCGHGGHKLSVGYIANAAADTAIVEGGHATTLADDALLAGGDAWPGDVARWLAQPENHYYFRGPVHLTRCRAWRARHAGYWRKSPRRDTAPKDVLTPQAIGSIHRGKPQSLCLEEFKSNAPPHCA